jgi:hypothetical protein
MFIAATVVEKKKSFSARIQNRALMLFNVHIVKDQPNVIHATTNSSS